MSVPANVLPVVPTYLQPLPPGPKGRPFVGNLLDFNRDPLAFCTLAAEQYGPIVPIRMGHLRVLVVTDPDLIEQVLVTDNRRYAKHFYIRLLSHLLQDHGLLNSEGDFWRRQRRLVQPAFHRSRIAAYGEIMVAYAQEMVAGWQDGTTRDIHADMMALTVRIVAKTLLNTDAAGVQIAAHGLENLMQSFEEARTPPVIMPTWVPTRANRRMRSTRAELDELIYGIIAEHRASGEDRGDLISMLLAARDEEGQGMPIKQVRDEALTIFLAGHETTANALSWTWYLLSQHPEVEACLLDELGSVLGGRAPQVADLPHLRYTEMVLTESMRLYPPAWAVGREPVEDVQLGSYSIKKGTNVILPQWVVHRSARFYADPQAFKPERGAGDLAKRLPRFAYFPFGGGPRVCIGNSFALMEGTLLLATIVQAYHLALAPDARVVLWPSITLRPRYGLRMKLARR